MAETLPTVELSTTNNWGYGSSGPGVRPGFSQTADHFPAVADVWPNYYTNVMRGRQDGPWYDSSFYTVVDYSKTYVELSANNEAPPTVSPTMIDGTVFIGQGGDPIGGMRPSESSPGEGNGLDYTAMKAIYPITPANVMGYGGDGTNGSVVGPAEGSESQHNCVDGTSISPVYYAGYSGYSNPTGT